MLIVVAPLFLSGGGFEYVYFTPLTRLVSLGEEEPEVCVMHGCWERGISSKEELTGLMSFAMYQR